MKLNIFSVPATKIRPMESKFHSVGLKLIDQGVQSDWQTAFYFSEDEEPQLIPWVNIIADLLETMPRNLVYFGAFIFTKGNRCFVLTFGKSHFYARQFCDHDFGIEMAKRIADENDIKMTASKKFAGKRKKEIKAYANNTPLNVESGESVDFLRATIIDDARTSFGKIGKFGSSMLVNPPIERAEIGGLLDEIVQLLDGKPQFSLPRTMRITDEADVARYDQALLAAILGGTDSPEFVHASHDLVGVDFVFSGDDQYTLSCAGRPTEEFVNHELDLLALRDYVQANRIPASDIFSIKVRVTNEGQRSYTKSLKEALDFIIDGESVMLSQGHWLRFNEDYIDQLHAYIDSIAIEETETHLRTITLKEPEFNLGMEKFGYTVADKDFSKIKTDSKTPIEAWDLQRDSTVYAVKFGTPQKVGYVCDQAIAVLEIIRNNANLKKLDKSWKSYCLWFGFENQNMYERISECDSIILKQKIEVWARRCRELGIEPKLKLSQRSKPPKAE